MVAKTIGAYFSMLPNLFQLSLILSIPLGLYLQSAASEAAALRAGHAREAASLEEQLDAVNRDSNTATQEIDAIFAEWMQREKERRAAQRKKPPSNWRGPIALLFHLLLTGAVTWLLMRHLLRRRSTFGLGAAMSLSRTLFALPTALLVLALHAPLLFLALHAEGQATILVPAALAAMFLWSSLSAATPAAVAEGLGPIDAVQRSVALTAGYRPKIFLAALLMYVVQSLLFIVLGVIAVEFLRGIVPAGSTAVWIMSIALCLWVLVWCVLAAVSYVELIETKEGFDPAIDVSDVFA